LYLAVNIVKEANPYLNLTNYKEVTKEINKNFDCEVKESDIEKLFQPSIEGITDDYKYFLKMASYE
jgi:hypothetical protein